MRLLIVVLVGIALIGQGCRSERYQYSDFVGEWYFVDLDKNVDSSHSILIKMNLQNLRVDYVNHGRVSRGSFELSEKDRGLTGNLDEYGRVVVRKIVSTGELSMDQVNEIEDIPIGFFQKKEVLEKLLKRKLP